MSFETEDEVERLIAECVERMGREGPAVLDAMVAEHPEHEAALRARVALGRELGLIGELLPAAAPRRLGEFTLFELLGGGGMGFVYRARQEGLGRDVAVKVIRPEYLNSPVARERFRREAQAVARLQHPGIVPLFSVGEDGGMPFLVMERVEGRALSEILEALEARGVAALDAGSLQQTLAEGGEAGAASDRPTERAASFRGTWVAACLRLARQVAEALEHAHGRGVVHRDVKPSNLMLTPSGRVLLLDFGLARDTELSRMTATANELGSLPYMAPERLRGATSGPEAPADIYGLGVTLYEMLALRLPFEGTDRDHARSLILEGRAPALRRLNPAVSWEVETICGRAMDVDPQRRYATAADFARDLGNALEGRPIEARRSGLVRRLRNQLRRRPAASLAALLAIGLFVVAPSLHAWRQGQLVEEARAAQRRAESLTTVAQETTGFLWDIVDTADAWTWMRKGLSDPAALGEQARAIVARCEDREIRAQLARTLAITCKELGLEGVAEDLAKIAMVDLDATGESRGVRRSLASHYAQILCNQGRYDEAEALVDEVITSFERSGDAPAFSLAMALAHRGEILRSRQRSAEGLVCQERALEILQVVAPQRKDRIVAHQSRLGMYLREVGQLDRAEELCRAAVEGSAGLGDPDLEARLREQLVAALRSRGRRAEALEENGRARELLLRVHPPGHIGIARVEMAEAKMLFELRRSKEARPGLEAAYARRRELSPAPVAEAVAMLGVCYEYDGDYLRSRELLEEAINLNDAAVGDWRVQGSHYRYQLGRLLSRRLQEPEEARVHLQESARLVAAVAPRSVGWAQSVHLELVRVCRALEDPDGAARAMLAAARATRDLHESIRYARAAGEALQRAGAEDAALEAWRFALSRFDRASPAARAPLQAELEELRARIDGLE